MRAMMLSIDDVKILVDGLDHPECVAWHPDGSVWAGGEAGQIYRISPDGSVEVVANTGGFILGLAFSPKRDWLAVCDLKKKCIWKLDLTSHDLSLYSSGVAGHAFNIPNYICFDRHGDFYVSESGAFREVSGKILKYSNDGEGKVWSNGPFNFSNGMALDARENFLYVVCSFLPGVERVRIEADGSAGPREVFATLPESVPDGLAFDESGNLYVSCYAPNKVYRIDTDRRIHTLIDDWEGHTICNPTNIAFGGKDFDQLYFANLGRWHVGKVASGTRGLKLNCHY